MTTYIVRTRPGPTDAAELLTPRSAIVLEREVEAGIFEAVEGPVERYRREVDVDEDGTVTQRISFSVAIPYFGWLFAFGLRRALSRPERARPPWWAPPARVDAAGAAALGSIALLGVAFGYLNTLFTQTIPFAGEQFAVTNTAQGVAGSVVRLGGIVSLAVVAVADRRGRRPVVLATALAGTSLAATGALAPSLSWLVASQVLARGFASALLVLLTIMAAEEMPARARAWAVSLLTMAGGLGAGTCVLSLRLADLGPGGWRLLYLIPILAVPVILRARGRLPESRRFKATHPEAPVAGHGRRLWLLAGSGLLASVFVAPQTQFGNQFLRTERGFSGGRIGLFSALVGAPAAIGIFAGGHLADVRGRRIVAAVALVGGACCTIAFFFSSGWPIWVWALVGNIITAASIPALGVYGPELFPTSLRGRANGIVTATGLAGSAIGLTLAGTLADSFGRIGPAMAMLAVSPLVLALVVLVAYPETAGAELEDLNPEDRSPTG